MATVIKNLRLKIVIGIIGTLVIISSLTIGGYFLFGKGYLSAFIFKQQLAIDVSRFNKECPILVDDDTRLDEALLLDELEIQYSYTCFNIDAENYDAVNLRKTLTEHLTKTIKEGAEYALARQNKVGYSYVFNDKKGIFLMTIHIGFEQYGAP
jgi:hypothetical protein